MDYDDPEKRIADLEHQLAEQKRIAELERQLAEAKAAAGQSYADQQPPGTPAGEPVEVGSPAAGASRAQRIDAFQQGNVTVRTTYPGQPRPQDVSRGRTRRGFGAGSLVGGIGGAFGICVGGAAALTALFPSSALWTSAIVCGAPHQLMSNSSHYSYKPGQSGTSISFQCLGAKGAHSAGFFAITGLQALFVAVVLAGLFAAGGVVFRLMRKQRVGGSRLAAAAGLGILAVAAVAVVSWQAMASSAGGLQLPQGGSLTIHGNGDTQTLACNSGHLTITGRAETVTVTGHCSSIKVSGITNHVTVDSVDTIIAGGINNVVTYHSGTPQITNSGAQNTVQQG